MLKYFRSWSQFRNSPTVEAVVAAVGVQACSSAPPLEEELEDELEEALVEEVARYQKNRGGRLFLCGGGELDFSNPEFSQTTAARLLTYEVPIQLSLLTLAPSLEDLQLPGWQPMGGTVFTLPDHQVGLDYSFFVTFLIDSRLKLSSSTFIKSFLF